MTFNDWSILAWYILLVYGARELCYFICHLDCITVLITARIQENSSASIAKTTRETRRLHDSVNVANQNDKSSWIREIGHTYNSTQTHIRSAHSVNESCVTASKDQAHINSSEKSLHEGRQSRLFVQASMWIYSHFISQSAQDISSLALPPLPVYNQTVLPFMLTYALLSFIVHDGFI